MVSHDILAELVLVLAVSAITVYFLRKAKVPETAGFIVAGIIIGPGGAGLITDRQGIQLLAEVGVIFLLFAVGLKLSLRDLWRMRSNIFGMGSLQVTACIGVTLAAALGIVQSPSLSQGILWGCLLALSSTAMVIQLLETRGTTHSPAGRSMLGMLLFQDLAVVPMLVVLPLLAHQGDGSWTEVLLVLLESIGILAVAVLAARYLFPWITTRVINTRSRELFTLTTLLVALGTALVLGKLGLSMALGAFLAGIVVSESEHSPQILNEIIPLRDAFSGLFFVSIGMLVEPRLWWQQPVASLGMLVAVVLGKAIILGAVALLFRRGIRTAIILGLGLAHVGEFSFVVANEALRLGLLTDGNYTLFLAMAAPTMILTPFAMNLAPRLANGLERAVGSLRPSPRHTETAAPGEPTDGHVVIVGFGINGQNVARVLRLLNVPYSVMELNTATVRLWREKGEPIHFSDACREPALRQIGIERARALVVSTADPPSARQIVVLARTLNPSLTIVVRTRFLLEVEALEKAGADQVIPEELETSLALVRSVMKIYGATDWCIERETSALRDSHYGFFRGEQPSPDIASLRALLSHAAIEEIKLAPGSPAHGHSLQDLNLREQSGATVIAVRRAEQNISNPDPATELATGDVLFLFGDGPSLVAARSLLERTDA